VIGHSNGGMLAVRHVADHPRTPGLVLLSAQCGGRAMVRHAAAAGALDGLDLESVAATARSKVAQGRGRELISLPGWWYVSSAESFLDRMDNLPDTLGLAPRIVCPSLYLRGDSEPADLYPAEAFARLAAGPCTVSIVEQCDHFYRGREAEITRRVSGWFESTLAAARQEC
jgi:pimeloyl-ACP methyl ester carboxylesterase